MMDRKVAIVTAASAGIGKAIAQELAADHELVVMSRSDAISDVARELGACAVRGDVRSGDDLDRLVTTALDRYGRVDAVAINTGHPPKGKLLDLTEDDWRAGYDLVLSSVMSLVKLVTPVFVRQGTGSVVAVASYAARTPEPTMPVSSVFRSALQAWIKLYATEYGPAGVRANTILPGYIATHPQDPARVATIPAGRYGHPAEIGKLAAFLLSDGAGFVSGQAILADGGMVTAI
ncbi:3-oxoacyl-ACP reductase [Acrocarpospora macrocephala]|uniref:3-oxoacyl-ACP reductase n=2 Tax=Acrocarpospora macrocephala TaxID=150177 RepID=A0A5M3WE49_9ACTN|nr:3-oxoacyl-ACP reductase [Acrocarpospora macrocephala]